jgi:hypothetical protein
VILVANPIPNPGRFHPEDSEHLVAPQFNGLALIPPQVERKRCQSYKLMIPFQTPEDFIPKIPNILSRRFWLSTNSH